jgi:glycosyltransferase involved in cell wall biosynthesis
MPKLIVCLPVYNGAKHLQETIESINKQSYRDFAVIASDDASSDGSYNLLEEASRSATVPWICLRNTVNKGVAGNWNRCFHEQRKLMPEAEYLVIVEQDDFISGSLFEHAVECLDSDRKPALCHFSACVLDNKSQIPVRSGVTDIVAAGGYRLDRDYIMPGRNALRYFIRYDNFILTASGVVFRTAALQACRPQGADESLKWAADYDLWSKLCTQGALAYRIGATVTYRVHAQQCTSTTEINRKQREARLISLRAYRRSLPVLGLRLGLKLLPICLYKEYLLLRYNTFK